MDDPLEPPSLPSRGDDTKEPTFLGVGKLISAWETIEFELSRLYSVFAGNPDGDAMREYGKPTIARLRIEGLAKAAAQFFVRHPSQETEGTFSAIMTVMRSLASRRNEVAHGIIFNIRPIGVFRAALTPEARKKKEQWAIIAPFYAIKQHDPDGLPAYAYTSRSLEILFLRMAAAYVDLSAFRKSALSLHEALQPSKRRRPYRETKRGRRRKRALGRARHS